ncbi:MAG: hypothetical protein AAB499_00700, partial [Patescibacteria group bacterium]
NLRTELKVGTELPVWYDHRLAKLGGGGPFFEEAYWGAIGLTDPIWFRLGERGRSYTGSAKLTIGEEVAELLPIDNPGEFVREIDIWVRDQMISWSSTHLGQSLPDCQLTVEVQQVS